VARIVVLTGDVLGTRMAGPAIRALNIADQLASSHDVSLVTTAAGPADLSADSLGDGRFRILAATSRSLHEVVAAADVVILQGYVSHQAPWLLRGDQVVVVDLYDPLHLEQLEQARDLDPGRRQAAVDLTVRVLNEQLLRADFMMCASDEQRHLWLGHLAALGRVNVATYGEDPTLRSLLAVCPFGLSSAPPEPHGSPIRAGLGLGPDAKVVLWAGGVHDWLDPLTAIRAIDLLRRRRPEAVLVFQGMQHPNAAVAMSMPDRCRQLADELDLTGRHVFFNDAWVPYADRQGYLLDADLGLCTSGDHLESQFAFRSRVLDHLWSGRPVVLTEGDALARKVRDDGLGAVVPPGDVEGLAGALETMLFDATAWSQAAANVERVRAELTWDRTLAPLVEFCAAPRRAADAAQDRARLVRRPVLPARALPRLAARAGLVLRRGGVREVANRAAAVLRRNRH
jgi:glycosyltransferase involved in cell wall biosynthesis